MSFVLQTAGVKCPLLPESNVKPPIAFNSHYFTDNLCVRLKYWLLDICVPIKICISDSRSHISKNRANVNIRTCLCTAVRKKPEKLQVLKRNLTKEKKKNLIIAFNL